jgi:hypothetical protein
MLCPCHRLILSSIRRLVKQLIFRLNQQQFRNNRYKKKDTTKNHNVSRRGTSIEDPINVDESSLSPKQESTMPSLVQPVDSPLPHQQSRIVKLPLPPKKGVSSTAGRNKSTDAPMRVIQVQKPVAPTFSRHSAEQSEKQVAPIANMLHRMGYERSASQDKDLWDVPASPEPISTTVSPWAIFLLQSTSN